MIIKGSVRGQNRRDGNRLAAHLLADENEVVEVLYIDGVVSRNLPDAVEELRLLSAGSRVKRALYHGSINLGLEEASAMTDDRWREAVNELAGRLGMAKHPRVVVKHTKNGREHVHVVFARVDPITLRVARDSHNYRIHEECSRALEKRFGLKHVTGALVRPKGTCRPVARATHGDWQASERTGIQVKDVSAVLCEAWRSTETGQDFAIFIQNEGLFLAKGRHSIVVVDAAGTPHSLPRRLGLRARAVRKRLSGIDMEELPSIRELKNQSRRYWKRGRSDMSDQQYFVASRGRRATRSGLVPDYWHKLGYATESRPSHIWVRLSPTVGLMDYGDKLVLNREGEPTDDEVRLLVSAGRERGWTEIRFSGGSPEFQRKSRLEALRQGYRPDQIVLECEGEQRPPPIATLMPSHVRRKLAPPVQCAPPEQPQDVPAAVYELGRSP